MPSACIEKHFTVDHDLPGRDNKFVYFRMRCRLYKHIEDFSSAFQDLGVDFQLASMMPAKTIEVVSTTNEDFVIIRVKNEEDYIGHAIQSCLDFIPGDIEIVVVDNNSTDQSINVARMFQHDTSLPQSPSCCESKLHLFLITPRSRS